MSTNRVISTTFVTHHFRIVLNFNVKTIKASPEYWVRDACLYKVKDVQSKFYRKYLRNSSSAKNDAYFGRNLIINMYGILSVS